MFPPRTKPYGTVNAESERFSPGGLPFEPRKHLLRARNARFVPFSPSAKAALDGAKGVHGAVEGASGALGAIHGWQRAPESLAACGGVGPTAQGAVGEPESGGRYELGKCLLFGGRVLAFSVSDRYYSAHADRGDVQRALHHVVGKKNSQRALSACHGRKSRKNHSILQRRSKPPRMATTEIPPIPSVANAGVCSGCSRMRRDRRTPCTKHRWSRSGSLE